MLSVFSYACNAIASIFLISIFGYYLKQKKVVNEEFTKKLNSLIFKYFLSVNLFFSVYSIESVEDLPFRQMVFCAIFILFMFTLGIFIAPRITKDNTKRSVLAQASFRSNAAVLGIALAGLLGGTAAEQTASMFITVSVTMFNALAVICFTIFAPGTEGQPLDIKRILSGIYHNPLIRGLMAGILCLILRAILPTNAEGHPVFSIQYNLPAVYNALSNISKVASPMLIFLLGARFDFSSVRPLRKYIIIGVTLRNFIAPFIGYLGLYLCSGVLHLFEASPVMYQGMIGVLATPCAISSVVMASEMGGDDTLASQLVVWSSLTSILSLFIIIVVLRTIGLM